MQTIILIVLGLAVLFLIVFVIRAWLFGGELCRNFQRCNVVVDGKKGKGKDLVFQYVINRRKKPYYSNIDYGGKHDPIKLEQVSTKPNTYIDFISEKLKPTEAGRLYEKQDVYISDGGVFLPSYMDSTLYKLYASMPIYYALSRHLAEHNIHVNIQNESRLWKALREQADYFVHVQKNIKLPHFILLKLYTYEKEESVQRVIKPMKRRLFNKFSKAEADQFEAEHGEIKGGWLIIRKKSIKYDTRAFEKKLYGDTPRNYRPKKPWLSKMAEELEKA